MDLERCFVIQPFDYGVFDKRYADVVEPAIRAANLEPYRVDRDPQVEVPITEIESGIRDARICVAEITTNNPNVWYELGFAFAARKSVVLVCAENRDGEFPFDVRHRSILRYKTDSTSDFQRLSVDITARLNALLEKEETLQSIADSSPVANLGDLTLHEITALATVMQNLSTPFDTVDPGSIRLDMKRAGFTDLAVSLALRSLLRNDFLKISTVEDLNSSWDGYQVTEKGERYLQANSKMFNLRTKPIEHGPFDDFDKEDIPF